MSKDLLSISLAQISPVWLRRTETIEKMLAYISEAADKNSQLVVFGETLLPGYPFWVDKTDGARFNSALQKELFSIYLDQSVSIEKGDLDPLCRLAAQREITIVTGVAEKALDRGGHSVYCSMVTIDNKGNIRNVHRKMMPTYEERLVWAIGDGHGLKVQELGPFTMGGLNCWENWMPLSRAALYGQGEDFHIALWPGGDHNTHDITRFIAKEARSYVLSVSGLLHENDIPSDTPAREKIVSGSPGGFLANGGSCLAGPNREWIIPPIVEKEVLETVIIDHSLVRQERHNFDPPGHYSRPDVTQLIVNRERQSIIKIID